MTVFVFACFVHGKRFAIGTVRVVFLLRWYVPCRVYFISGGGDFQYKFIYTPSL